MRIFFRSLAVLVAVIFLSSPVDAQRRGGGRSAGGGGGICGKDIKEFCSTVEPGEGRVFRCLLDHSSVISVGCEDAVKKLQERNQQHLAGQDQGQKGSGAQPNGKGNQASSPPQVGGGNTPAAPSGGVQQPTPKPAK